MIASDDEQRTWEDTSSSALRFAGLAGIRPLALSAIAALLVVLGAVGWSAAPFIIAVCALLLLGLYPESLRHFSDRSISSLSETASPAGSFVVPRALLAVAAYLATEESVAGAVVVALVIGELSIALSLRTFTDRALPVAANLPGLKGRSRVRLNPTWSYFASTLPTVFLALSAQWHVLMWVALATALLLIFLVLGSFLEVALLIRSRLGDGPRITRALTEYAPEFVLHWKAPKNTEYQVAMWLPHLEASGAKFFVLVRDPVNFAEAERLTSRPIILRETLNSLDDVVVPSLKAALYVNTATVNNHLLRYRQLTHIQLNHGDSEKVTSYNPVFRAYDKNFVAGQAAVDRFERHGVDTVPGFFELVGRPQTARVSQDPRPREANEPLTALYAPSWHGFYNDTNYSSLDSAERIVQVLLEQGHNVIFRPHPYSLKDAKYRAICERVNGLLEQTNDAHIYGEAATGAELFDLFNKSDFLVSDVSSVTTDYITSTKPIVLINGAKGREYLGPLANAVYIVEASQGVLEATKLASAIITATSTDPLAKSRVEARDYLLKPSTNPEALFATCLRKFL